MRSAPGGRVGPRGRTETARTPQPTPRSPRSPGPPSPRSPRAPPRSGSAPPARPHRATRTPRAATEQRRGHEMPGRAPIRSASSSGSPSSATNTTSARPRAAGRDRRAQRGAGHDDARADVGERRPTRSSHGIRSASTRDPARIFSMLAGGAGRRRERQPSRRGARRRPCLAGARDAHTTMRAPRAIRSFFTPSRGECRQARVVLLELGVAGPVGVAIADASTPCRRCAPTGPRP